MLNPSDIQQDFVRLVIGELHRHYGVDFAGYNRNFIRRRIASRMNRLGISAPMQYFKILGSDVNEFSQLLQNLTINTTEFMRNPEVFLKMEKFLLPKIAEEIAGNSLMIWSAGCSRGQEPYSIAMILMKLRIPERMTVRIFATDIDEIALDKARKGLYDAASLSTLSPTDVKIFFERKDNGSFSVKNNLKKMIIFKKHDVVDGQSLGKFNLIVCRNVSIYFTKNLQMRMYRRFYEDLLPGGYLITGKTETPPTRFIKEFECVDLDNRIYRKAR